MKLAKVGNIWEIRKKVIAGNKKEMKVNAIIDPKTGKLVLSKQKIKEVTLDYCKATLAKNQPEKEYADQIESKKR